MSSDNVQVFCRVRPPNSRERKNGSRVIVRVENDSNVVLEGNSPRTFTFDHAVGPDGSQEEVFLKVGKPISEACLEGYNGTIFAYGQTGSGKTHTIMGPENGSTEIAHVRGLVPRVLDYIFYKIFQTSDDVAGTIQYFCKCSFLEIYNERIIDLQVDNPSAAGLSLREDMQRGVYVENLTETLVSSAEEAQNVMLTGSQNRHIGSTAMNRESSRSHSVFTLTIEAKEKKGDITRSRCARFHLIDLAGSERQRATETSGERLKEASNINKSLSALGNVINALVEISKGRKRHVHYRDSKLTFLLRDSLGGNSKTNIIAAISPSSDSFGETLSTLQFAARAKMVQNRAVVNEDYQGSVERLQAEIKTLKARLMQYDAINGIPRSIGPSSSDEDVDMEGGKAQQGAPGAVMSHTVANIEMLKDSRVRSVEEELKEVLWRTELVEKERESAEASHSASEAQAKASETKILNLQLMLKLRESQVRRLSGQGVYATTLDSSYFKAQRDSVTGKLEDSEIPQPVAGKKRPASMIPVAAKGGERARRALDDTVNSLPIISGCDKDASRLEDDDMEGGNDTEEEEPLNEIDILRRQLLSPTVEKSLEYWKSEAKRLKAELNHMKLGGAAFEGRGTSEAVKAPQSFGADISPVKMAPASQGSGGDSLFEGTLLEGLSDAAIGIKLEGEGPLPLPSNARGEAFKRWQQLNLTLSRRVRQLLEDRHRVMKVLEEAHASGFLHRSKRASRLSGGLMDSRPGEDLELLSLLSDTEKAPEKESRRMSMSGFRAGEKSGALGRYVNEQLTEYEEINETLKARVEEAEATIAQLSKAKEALTADVASLTTRWREAETAKTKMSERVEQLEALAGSRKLAVDKLEAILRSQQEEQENKESVETQMAVLEVQKQLAEARRHNTVLATKYDAECKKSAGLSEELQALKQQYDESTMEVTRLEESLRDSQDTVATQTRSIDNLREQVDRLEKQLNSVQDEAIEANKRASSLQDDVERLHDSLVTSEGECSDLYEEKEFLMGEVKAAKKAAEEANLNASAKESQIAFLNRRIEDLERKVSAEDLRSKIAALSTQVEEEQQRANDIQSALETLREELAQKEQEYAASQSSLETMKEAYRKADAALLEERAKYQQVSAAMEDAQREIGELKTKASAHKHAAEVTLQELKEMRDHYAALKTEHEALAKELQETREKMAELERENIDVSSEMEVMQSRMEELKREMEEKQREAQRQKEDVDMQSYPETIERLNTILNERNAECDSLKTQLQELDRHTSDLEHRLQQSQARAEKAESEAEKAIEQQKLAAESVENAQRAVSKSVNRESMFSSQVEAMTERVSQLEAELEAWKGREQKACTEADNARSRVREYEDKLSYLRHQLEEKDRELQHLMGHSNTKQRINYTQQLKKEVNDLRERLQDVENENLVLKEKLGHINSATLGEGAAAGKGRKPLGKLGGQGDVSVSCEILSTGSSTPSPAFVPFEEHL